MGEPILSWAGGKRHLLEPIMDRLPSKELFDTYYEPFFGGGAVFFELAPSNGYINDVNPKLMNFYRQVQEQPERIISENKSLDDKFQPLDEEGKKEFYYERREEFNSLRQDGECKDRLREAVLFLFLNRSCWNSLYRTNQDGEFNVPYGTKPTPIEPIEPRIREGHRILQNTSISSTDFTFVEDLVEEDDLVYFDPPYPGSGQTASFEKYVPGGFDEDKQTELRDLARRLDERGAYVLITNGPGAIDLYKDGQLPNFRIKKINGERRINSDSTKRTDIGSTDIIVTNISPFEGQHQLDSF